MRIILNGNDHEVPERCTVVDLVTSLDLGSNRVAVEVNRHLIRRAEHAGHILSSGDIVEVVTLVGGG